ncbi:MAG: N-6 DNA methylase [Deltaproteobacteria bacterium]|nr:N-6 DNA methylase [Kofleriaceae bacterium]
MPTKRQVVETLHRNELLALADLHELDVEDRRVRDQLVDAISSSRNVVLADALAELSRDRLKELCRALGLDDSGREKSQLVERLTGQAAKEPTSNGKSTKNGRGAETKANGEAAEMVLGEKLTQAKLEGYLWSAADILRGSIDSSDYKSFIFGLLFLKRLSDRFDEECAALLAEGGDPEDRDEHQFFVPRRARWSEIQKASTRVGETLNKACFELEKENGSLEGVLAGIDFNDERKLGDARNRDVVLGKLVQHFSKVDLRNASLSEPDMLGRAYEYLIEKFADDAGKKGGEFYTPKKVVELIVELLAPTEGMRICDPTCGSGGMLIECAHYLQRRGKNQRNLSLSGQEKNLGTWAICKMNMLLHGLPDAKIEKGDTIRDPKLRSDEGLALFSRVIANPPFSLDEWGREVAENDPYGRFRFGVPPKTKGDLAFVQHMIATTDRTGMVGVVMPHGVLFRGAAEGEIRKSILQEDLVEAVIGLPPNLFYGTGIPAAILILNKDKRPERKRKVLFIEASREFREGSSQNYLRDEDVKKIAATFHAFKDVVKYARLVGLDVIEKNEFNLNISRYVETADAAQKIDVASAITKLREFETRRAEAEARMNAYLKELGYDA